jgi:hypothetical protein
MKSQVQVLAGPPPIVAGQSATGSALGALAAGLGRARAARPSPPAPPVAPPGPPTRASASAATTHRGRAPSRGRQPRVRCRHLARPPAPMPTAQPPARGAPDAGLACVVAQRSSAAAAARPQPGGPGPPPTCHRPPRLRQRRPRPGLLDRRSSRRRPGSHRGLHRFRWSGSPGRLDPVPTPPPEHGRRRTRPDRPGQTPDGWTADGRTPDGWTADGWTAGRSARRPQVTGHRTAGQPDPGRRNRMGGHRMRTPATDAVACLLAVSTTATTPDRSTPAGRSSGQTPSGRATTRTAQQQGLRGHPRCYGRVWPPPRQSAAGGTPPSSWRLGALLSSDDYGSSVERAAHGQVLWQVHPRMGAVEVRLVPDALVRVSTGLKARH